MLQVINQNTKRLTREIPGKDGKTKKVTQKRDIYIYAHNSANFDSFFYLNVPEV